MKALAVLLSPPPTEREAYVATADRIAVFTSKKYFDAAKARERAAAAYDRAFYPEGASRQLANEIASVFLRHKPLAKRWLRLVMIDHSCVPRIVRPPITSD